MYQETRNRIQELEDSGLRVNIAHSRYLGNISDWAVTSKTPVVASLVPARRIRDEHRTSEVNPRGGSTKVEIVDEARNVVASYTAFCHPKDHFNKAKGAAIALAGAVKDRESRL